MQKTIRQHHGSKRTAAKPHLQSRMSDGTEGHSSSRPSRKKAARKGDGSGARAGKPKPSAQAEEVDSGAATLVTLQRESDGRWLWQAYDKFGLRISYQEKLTDALHCIEEIVKFLAFEAGQTATQ